MTDRLTLDVENRPTINEGDTLLVTPDVGRPYRARVLAVEGDRLKVRIPPDPRAPHPTGSRTTHFDREELEAWYVRCDLTLNPRPPHRRGVA